MSLGEQLKDSGFVPAIAGNKGDFILQDDSDGNGPYIRAWLSEAPCPFPELIREPIEVVG